MNHQLIFMALAAIACIAAVVPGLRFDAGGGDGGSGGGAGGSSGGNGGSAEDGAAGSQEGSGAPDFDTWYASLDDAGKAAIDAHTSGLRGALDKERKAARTLQSQLTAASKSAGDNAALKAELEKLAADQADAITRADFFEEGAKKGISNLKLAFITAKSEGLIDDRGRVNWDELKKGFPELFGKAAGGGHDAGRGGGSGGAAGGDMNSIIRGAAGYRS